MRADLLHGSTRRCLRLERTGSWLCDLGYPGVPILFTVSERPGGLNTSQRPSSGELAAPALARLLVALSHGRWQAFKIDFVAHIMGTR